MITLRLKPEPTLKITMSAGTGTALPIYDGDYVVVPRKVDQELLTKNKAMSNNVLVEKITRTETSNEAGGNTVIIGFD